MALIRNKTWSLVSLLPDRSPIGCRWMFKVKRNSHSSVSRHKTRLMAKGLHQKEGFDFFETFRPVVKPATIRIVLTLPLSKGWSLRQIDINNAFLIGDLKEQVYMKQPPGFSKGDGTLVQTSQSHIWPQTGSQGMVCQTSSHSSRPWFHLCKI